MRLISLLPGLIKIWLWCLVCGCYSTSQLRERGSQCSFRLGRAGPQNLSRISKGPLPGSRLWGRERQERRARGSGLRGGGAAAAARCGAFNADVVAPAVRRRPASAPPPFPAPVPS
eukprot:6451747-Pyramimonas_sp.AAC.1